MEDDCGVISDPRVTMFVVTDGVADITPASSVILATLITHVGAQACVEGCHGRKRLLSQVGRQALLWVRVHSVFLLKSKFLRMPGVMTGTVNLSMAVPLSPPSIVTPPHPTPPQNPGCPRKGWKR